MEYKQQSNIAFQLLIRSQFEDDLEIDLRELMRYPLTHVPYSCRTADGFLNKTDKSKGFHRLTQNVQTVSAPPDHETMTIEDDNAIFNYFKELPATFKDICSKVFDIAVKRSDMFPTIF